MTLARNQKVDIAKISVLELADQYLEFMEWRADANLELAADYLVMAAWLAYLKSRLVLPQAKRARANPPPTKWPRLALAAAAARCHARARATRLMGRERLDRDVFGRGDPEPVRVIQTRANSPTRSTTCLTSYSQQRIRVLGHRVLQVVRAPIFLIEEARARIERSLGANPGLGPAVALLPPGWGMGAPPSHGAGQHIFCRARTRARRQDGNPPDGAVRRNFSERPRAGG